MFFHVYACDLLKFYMIFFFRFCILFVQRFYILLVSFYVFYYINFEEMLYVFLSYCMEIFMFLENFCEISHLCLGMFCIVWLEFIIFIIIYVHAYVSSFVCILFLNVLYIPTGKLLELEYFQVFIIFLFNIL